MKEQRIAEMMRETTMLLWVSSLFFLILGAYAGLQFIAIPLALASIVSLSIFASYYHENTKNIR